MDQSGKPSAYYFNHKSYLEAGDSSLFWLTDSYIIKLVQANLGEVWIKIPDYGLKFRIILWELFKLSSSREDKHLNEEEVNKIFRIYFGQEIMQKVLANYSNEYDEVLSILECYINQARNSQNSFFRKLLLTILRKKEKKTRIYKKKIEFIAENPERLKDESDTNLLLNLN